MFKKCFIVIAVLSITFSVSAQDIEGVNARLDAMGGCGVIGDIGWTVGKPCKIYAYPDQVQASAVIRDIEGLAMTYGQIIAIKSFGDHFFVGMTMNDKRAMSGFFYTAAERAFGFGENFTAMKLGRWLANWPHLNFCIRPNDNLALGIGGFIEQSRYDETKRKELKYSYENANGDTVENAIMEYDSTTYRDYFGFGINIDGMIWFGESGFKLNPEFRVFIPKLKGDRESNCSDQFNLAHKDVLDSMTIVSISDNAKSTDLAKNLFLRVGTKLSGTIGETFWIVGAWYKTEKYEFVRDTLTRTMLLQYDIDPEVTTINAFGNTLDYNKTSYDWWLGCQPSFSDNLIFCPEYSGGVYVYDKKYPQHSETRDTTIAIVKHTIRLGAEASIKDFWIFKELLPRFGIAFKAVREITDYKILDGIDSTVMVDETSWPFSSNWDKDLAVGKGAKISAGFGLKGKRGTFDLSLDVLEWKTTGVTGPGASMASFTLYFGKEPEE